MPAEHGLGMLVKVNDIWIVDNGPSLKMKQKKKTLVSTMIWIFSLYSIHTKLNTILVSFPIKNVLFSL